MDINEKQKKSKLNVKKIAILTSGGDSPGMNTAIYSLVRQCLFLNYEPYLVIEGYKGLISNNIVLANYEEVKKNAFLGGTFIYSARLPEFKELAVRQKAAANLKKRGIETLVVIGGDGSYQGANLLSKLGINCICLPGTIDNDIGSTDWTIGFFTSLASIDDAINKIRDTSISHNRVALIEVMGRYCDDLPFYSALGNGADLIITSKNFMSPIQIAEKVKQGFKKHPQRRTFIIIVAERMYGTNNNPKLEDIAQIVFEKTKYLTNVNKLGYLQRGGIPNIMDRILAMQMGMHAINLVAKNKRNKIVAMSNNKIVDYDLSKGIKIQQEKQTKKINEINKIQEEVY